jgi:hypothetical protein
MNLFTYRDLNAWLDNPFGTPPILPGSNLPSGWVDIGQAASQRK